MRSLFRRQADRDLTGSVVSCGASSSEAQRGSDEGTEAVVRKSECELMVLNPAADTPQMLQHAAYKLYQVH